MTEVNDRWQEPSEGRPLLSDPAGETALALARAWSRLSSPAEVALKRLGEIHLQPDEIAMLDDSAPVRTEGMAWFRLARATEFAWLGVTLDVCHGLIRALLGGPPPLLIRPLGSAERGLMSALVVSALDFLGLARRVSIVPDEGRPNWQGHPVLLAGTIRGPGGLTGRVLFVGPLSWLDEGGGHASSITRGEIAPVDGVLELGRTLVPEAELGAAAPGDAIAFDGIPSLLPGVAWPVNLLIAKSFASARLDSDNRLSLVGAWAQVDAEHAANQANGSRWTSVGPGKTTEGAFALAEVVVELGHIRLSGDELAGLSKGESLALGPRPSELVQLRVGGQLWATGLPVELGGQLGVRIVRLPG